MTWMQMLPHKVPSVAAVLLVVCASLGSVPSVAAQDATPVATAEASASIEQPPATTLKAPRSRSWLYGVRAGMYSTDGRGFLGGGVVLPVTGRFSFNPNGEWLFVNDIDRMFMVNADLQYDVPLDGNTLSWFGAGIGVRHFAKGDGWPPEHNLGLNLLGGLGFGQESGLIPYVQARIFIAGQPMFANAAEFVLSAGLRF